MSKVFEISVYGKNLYVPLWKYLFDDEEKGAKAVAAWLSDHNHDVSMGEWSDIFVRVVEYRRSSPDGWFLYHTSYVWM